MPDRYRFPPFLIARAVGLLLTGRLHVRTDRIGEVVKRPGEEDFVIFRQVFVDAPGAGDGSSDGSAAPEATFKVCFHFKSFSPRVNKVLSLIPIPFIVAQPGFRSKTWMLGRETGMFQGFYEWATREDAERYWTSFPLKLMKKRAVADSLTHSVESATGDR